MTYRMASSSVGFQSTIHMKVLQEESGLYSHHISHSKSIFRPRTQLSKLRMPQARERFFWKRKPLITPMYALSGTEEPDENEKGDEEEDSSQSGSTDETPADSFRSRLENIIDGNDDFFGGKELATLIRQKYGRSYDVQLIKREFMGRQLLAMNVMWKYREQRSFPLTEEQYLLRLDDVANNLRCWGAVSYVRNSLSKTKERPRIGKAVSIFIDLDDTGGRANEWIYSLLQRAFVPHLTFDGGPLFLWSG
ncbi:hypothetical protein O6H91_20G067000 [Diphasiastrum complanatum]|uniref:Uncharacterized protein n=1 Tax=Diphasiastrum complanatum TaxID=34168 RepID=A0ACC2ARG2_DIPCM|nr:hypothetical protein O6H91_20G067000 [Diphasiastrum complanatum]